MAYTYFVVCPNERARGAAYVTNAVMRAHSAVVTTCGTVPYKTRSLSHLSLQMKRMHHLYMTDDALAVLA